MCVEIDVGVTCIGWNTCHPALLTVGVLSSIKYPSGNPGMDVVPEWWVSQY